MNNNFIGDFTPESYEFMQQHAEELWEWCFKTCVYPDGTAYGISDGKQCRKAPEGELRDELSKVMKSRGIKANAKDIKRMDETIERVKEKYGDAGVAQLANMYSTFIPTDASRKTTSMNREEIEALQNPELQKKLMAGFDNPKLLQGGDSAIAKGREYDEELLDEAINGLPKSFVGKFRNIGKPAGFAYQGTDEDGNPINGKGGTDERAKALLKQWIRQDGRCAYTKLPLTLDYSDLEHVRPLGTYKAEAEQPGNWVWTRRSVNQIKSEKTMDEFLNQGTIGGQSGGVNGIKDIAAYEKNISSKAAKGGEKQKFRDLAADPKTAEEYYKNRETITKSFKGYERYLALALGKRPIDANDKLTMWDEVTRAGERNQMKSLINAKGTFKVGNTNGTGKPQQFSGWFLANYANMSTADKRKVKQIWAEVKGAQERNENSYGKTGKAFGQLIAERINKEFGES